MKKILLIQTAFIGDVILATAMIEKLSTFYPDSKIDFLLRKGNESLLKDNPKIDEILIWDKKNKKYQNLFRILKKVRLEKYDLVVNFQRFLASGFITAFSGANETRGFNKNPLSFLFSKTFDHQIGDGKHEVDRNLLLISDLTDEKRVLPKLYPSEQDLKAIEPYSDSGYITLAPTSVWFTKQLPIEKWAELIALIPNHIKIYTLGAPGDNEKCEELIRLSNRDDIQNLCGKLSLVQSAFLMKNAKMNYVNDSAPLHLASSVNGKTTAFFCSTIPDFGFGPLADESTILQIEENLNCRPCGLHGKKGCPEKHFDCGFKIKLKTNLVK